MENSRPDILKLGLTAVLRTTGIFILYASATFLGVGRLDWSDAIIFWAVYYLIGLATNFYLLKSDRALLREREEAINRKNVKPWDRRMLAVNMVLIISLLVLIGVDAGRYQWSNVTVILRTLGGIVILLSFGLSLWASCVNTYMSALVRIQEERGHRAVTGSPYRIIRHPMYAGMCLLYLGMPVLLNSWYGLIVNALLIAGVFIHTTMEDRTLQRELPGYSEYTHQT